MPRRILVELADALADCEVLILCVRAGQIVSFASVQPPEADVPLRPALVLLQEAPANDTGD